MISKKTKQNRGFTLIELIVVIAIIALLSALVLASLGTARTRSKEASIRQDLIQFRNILELDHAETGSYANLQKGTWLFSGTDCSGIFTSGNYATKGNDICKQLVNLSNSLGNGPGWGYVYISTWNPFDTNKYSITVFMPGAADWLCMGSSGMSEGIYDTLNPWTNLGCPANP